MSKTDKYKDYHQRIAADEEFQAQLERQFGKRAVDMRYSMDKSQYDDRTMAACQAFRVVNGLPLVIVKSEDHP